LDDLIAKFGAGRQVILIGHSAGGQLAAEFARVRGDEVDGLILVDPAILTTGGGPEGFDWFYKIPQIDRLGPILVSSIATSGDKLIYQSFFDQTKATPAVLNGYHRPLKIAGWERAFWNFATASKANELKPNLGKIRQPTILISGSNDTVVATADTVKLQTLIPGSTLEIISRAGHLPHEERPREFMAAIAKHWKQFAVK
jgi:pimeloyl-ACP methyl ester carboxylesterase